MNHDVTNQVPLFEGRNLFTSDPFLKLIVTTLTENNFAELLTTFGAACGTKERFEAGRLANENPPKLKNFDRFGHRTNEVEYHPSYHELMRFSIMITHIALTGADRSFNCTLRTELYDDPS